jgi:VWFA-related protein
MLGKLLLATVALAAQDVSFKATVPVVIAPVTVTGKNGKLVNGLDPTAFTVLDNGRAVKAVIDPVEYTTSPVAIAVLIQRTASSGPALLKIVKAGAMIQPLLAGERGSAAVIGYSHTLEVMQEFTQDERLIARAFQRATPLKSNGGKMLDAIAMAVEMFKRRPPGERRVILVIGESRDRYSETTLEATLEILQRENVQIYAATYSNSKTQWTTRGTDLKQSGAPMDLAAGIEALVRLGKINTAAALTEHGGGRKIGFATLKSLEKAIEQISEDLHGQYVASFPASGPPGYHTITITVAGANVITRQGYWSR